MSLRDVQRLLDVANWFYWFLSIDNAEESSDEEDEDEYGEQEAPRPTVSPVKAEYSPNIHSYGSSHLSCQYHD